jgi:hypothetical protein
MGNDLMKRSMGLLASTLLAAGLGVGGATVAAGPAAADTGLKSVTISAPSYQSYTNHDRDRDRDRDRHHNWKNHKKWCETHGYWKKERHGNHYHWKWVSYCDDDHRRGRH